MRPRPTNPICIVVSFPCRHDVARGEGSRREPQAAATARRRASASSSNQSWPSEKWGASTDEHGPSGDLAVPPWGRSLDHGLQRRIRPRARRDPARAAGRDALKPLRNPTSVARYVRDRDQQRWRRCVGSNPLEPATSTSQIARATPGFPSTNLLTYRGRTVYNPSSP